MRIIFLLFLVMVTAGCTSINIAGSQPSNLNEDLGSLYIIVEDSILKNDQLWGSNTGLASSASQFMGKVGTRSETQWPKIFKSRGLNVEVVKTSAQKQVPHFSIVLIDAPKSDSQYELFIKHKSITPKAFGLFAIEYVAELRDRKNRTSTPLWSGTINVKPGIWASPDDLTDTVAEKLLMQLRTDGVLRSENGKK